jgi:hypothetical protein
MNIQPRINTDGRGFKQPRLLKCFFGGLLAIALVGCRTEKNDIVFSDESSLPRVDTNAPAVLLKTPSLPRADERKIDFAVFSNLLTRHFWDDGGYTAIFLQADDEVVAALQKKFHDRQPPIKETYRANVRQNLSPLDKDTGKAAMILSVDVSEPEADGSVTAIGKWFAGGAVTGFYSYQLKKSGDDWEIQNSP